MGEQPVSARRWRGDGHVPAQRGGAAALVAVDPSRLLEWDPATLHGGPALLWDPSTLSVARVDRHEQWGHLVVCEVFDIIGGVRALVGVTDSQVTTASEGDDGC